CAPAYRTSRAAMASRLASAMALQLCTSPRRASPRRWHGRCSAVRVVSRNVCFVVFLAACTPAPAAPAPDPNAGLLRDFIDGKFDGAGHPLNGRVTQGATLCGQTQLATTCRANLPGAEQAGTMIVNARLRVTAHPDSGGVVAIALHDASNATVGSDTLTV